MTPEAHAGKLATILADMRALPGADRIVVFGSMATGKALPEDLDVFVDANAGPGWGALSKALIQMARRHYGWIDPFVLDTKGVLHVRNAEATGYTWAQNAHAIRQAIATHGKPLSQIPWTPAQALSATAQ